MTDKSVAEVKQVEDYCAVLWQWLELIEERVAAGDTDGWGVDRNFKTIAEAAPALRMAIHKSSYLGRRLYGGEAHRTERCPLHQGRWSGLPNPLRPPECGCDFTGWLPAE